MKALAFLLALTTLAFTSSQVIADEAPATDPNLPKILLIGDSISGGYEKQVKRALADKATVVKNAGNAEWSGTGLKKIDKHLSDTQWDIIHFNWGLWDIYGWRYDNEDRSPEAYAKRLEQLVTRMEKTGAKLIWATTTPGCPGPEVTMLKRFNKKVVITLEEQAKYRAAALGVMKKHQVEINDLYHHILPDLEKFSPAPDNVHYNGSGCAFLAEKVVASLESAMADLKK